MLKAVILIGGPQKGNKMFNLCLVFNVGSGSLKRSQAATLTKPAGPVSAGLVYITDVA